MTIFAPRIFSNKIFWNIRHSLLNFKISKKTTIFISFFCSIFSRYIPKKIIYCSEKSIKFHQSNHLYSKRKTILIDNGFSEKSFFSSKIKRFQFRKKKNFKKNDIIFGFVGRYTLEKNINSMLLGFSKIIKNNSNIYLCMVGKNINACNKELMSYINNYKIKDKVYLLEEQNNLVKFYNGIDPFLLTSHTESFPNVVAESCYVQLLFCQAMLGVQKIINKHGFIMKNNNHNTIFQNLKKIIKNF